MPGQEEILGTNVHCWHSKFHDCIPSELKQLQPFTVHPGHPECAMSAWSAKVYLGECGKKIRVGLGATGRRPEFREVTHTDPGDGVLTLPSTP